MKAYQYNNELKITSKNSKQIALALILPLEVNIEQCILKASKTENQKYFQNSHKNKKINFLLENTCLYIMNRLRATIQSKTNLGVITHNWNNIK